MLFDNFVKCSFIYCLACNLTSLRFLHFSPIYLVMLWAQNFALFELLFSSVIHFEYCSLLCYLCFSFLILIKCFSCCWLSCSVYLFVLFLVLLFFGLLVFLDFILISFRCLVSVLCPISFVMLCSLNVLF